MNRKIFLILGSAFSVVLASALILLFIPKPTTPDNNSEQKLFFYDGDTSQRKADVWKFTDNVLGSSSDSRLDSPLVCPETAGGVFAFASERGKELTIDGGWQAFSESGFMPGTHKVLTPNLQLSGLYLGSPGAQYLKKIGGDFSLGLACTTAQGNNVLTVSYNYIHIDAGTGDWTISPD